MIQIQLYDIKLELDDGPHEVPDSTTTETLRNIQDYTTLKLQGHQMIRRARHRKGTPRMYFCNKVQQHEEHFQVNIINHIYQANELLPLHSVQFPTQFQH